MQNTSELYLHRHLKLSGSLNPDSYFTDLETSGYTGVVLRDTLEEFIRQHDPLLRSAYRGRGVTDTMRHDQLIKEHEYTARRIIGKYRPTLTYLTWLAYGLKPNYGLDPNTDPSERRVRNMFGALRDVFITGDAIFDGDQRTSIKDAALRRAAVAHSDPNASALANGYLTLPLYRPFLREEGLTVKAKPI